MPGRDFQLQITKLQISHALVQTTIRPSGHFGEKIVRTEGLWVKCDGCRQIIWKKDLEENLNVCPKCDKHFRIDARVRLAQLLDDNQYEVFESNLVSTDPLKSSI